MGTYALIPSSCFFVRCCRTSVVTQFDFKQFGEILLVSGCTAKVAFAAVMRDGFVKTPCCCFWVVLSVCL